VEERIADDAMVVIKGAKTSRAATLLLVRAAAGGTLGPGRGAGQAVRAHSGARPPSSALHA
jgi:hypothetical protein